MFRSVFASLSLLVLAVSLYGETNALSVLSGSNAPSSASPAPVPFRTAGEQLEPVIIRSTRDRVPARKYPLSVEILTKEQIEKLPVKDVAGLLRTVPGLEVHRRSGQDFIVDIRGFNNGTGNAQRILLLINGQPAPNGDSGALDWCLVNLNDIERVEVIKGSAGILYGNGGAAGIVNIITVPKRGRSSAGLRMTYGSYNAFASYLSVDQSSEKSAVSFKADYSVSDGYRQKSGHEKKNVKLGLTHALNERTELEGSLSYGKAHYDYPGALTLADIAKDSERAASASPFSQNYNILFISGGLKHRLSPTADLDLLLGLKERTYDYSSGVSYKNDMLSMNLLGEKRTECGFFKNTLYPGLDLRKETILNPEVETTGKVSSVFLKDNCEILEDFFLTAGYRWDLLENIYARGGSRLKNMYRMDSWQCGASAEVVSGARVFLNYSRAYRIPVRDEVLLYQVDLTWTVTNIGLSPVKPEKAKSWDGGVKFSLPPFLRLDVNAYTMLVQDEIFYNGSVNTNYERITHQGAEARLDLDMIPMTLLEAGYTFQRVRFASGPFKEKRVPLTPEGLFSGMISLSPLKFLRISHVSRWRDRCFPANDMENRAGMLKSFWVSDLKLMAVWERLRLEFSLYNLYNERYSEYAGLNWAGQTGYYPSPRRNYELSASYQF